MLFSNNAGYAGFIPEQQHPASSLSRTRWCPGAHAVPARLFSHANASRFPRRGILFVKEYVNTGGFAALPRHGRYGALGTPSVPARCHTVCHTECRAQHLALPPHTSHLEGAAGADQPMGVIGRAGSALWGPALFSCCAGDSRTCVPLLPGDRGAPPGVAWSLRWVKTPPCWFGTGRLHRAPVNNDWNA